MRVARIDRAACRLVLDTGLEVGPAHAPATKTPEGYLDADAWLARDGLLKYSDGADEWLEFRPRAELERAAASWAATPITDDHPEAMVNAETWTEVARGIHLSCPTVTPPQLDGHSYLAARIRISDASLVAKVESGEAVQLSIGFTALVQPATDDSLGYAATQTELEGNHTAVLPKGRAGPSARVFLDGADRTVPTSGSEMKHPKKDEVGAPTEMVQIKGPGGEQASVPTWVAALLQQAMGGKMPGSAPAPPAPPAPPPTPAAPKDMLPPGGAPPPRPEDEQLDSDDEEKEPSKDAASSMRDIQAMVRRRARLERLGARVGLADSAFDQNDVGLSRQLVAKVLPQSSSLVGKFDAHQLDALVEVASVTPTEARTDSRSAPTTPAGLWIQPIPTPIADSEDDELSEAVVANLKAQGY